VIGEKRGHAVGLALLLAVGCGARTEIDLDPGSVAARDARPSDGGGDAPTDTGEPDTGPFDAGPPSPCAADRECGFRHCVADVAFLGEDLESVPLVCGALGPGASDGAFCNVASECDRGLCVVAGTCVEPCIDDTDCGGVKRCREVLARTGALSLQPYRGCVALHDAPLDVVVEIEEREDALRGRERELVLDRLETPGPTTWVVSGAAGLRIDPRLLTDPAGEVLYDHDAVALGVPPPVNPVVSFGRPLTVLVPNSPRRVPAGTTYLLRAAADERTDALIVSFGVEGPSRRTIDLDLYYVGGMGFRSSGLRGPRVVAEALDEVEAILGLRIGTVRQHEVVGGTRGSFAILEESSDGDFPELDELFRLSAGGGRPSINLFFVRQAGMALGVSGGIPGPAPMHGTDGSGIAIAADFIGAPGLPSLAQVLAHELGHHLGLFHTTERVGIVLEPLGDTPECPIDRDTSGDGHLSAEECRGAGADNLMFWAASGDRLTDDQRLVSHRSPVLY